MAVSDGALKDPKGCINKWEKGVAYFQTILVLFCWIVWRCLGKPMTIFVEHLVSLFCPLGLGSCCMLQRCPSDVFVSGTAKICCGTCHLVIQSQHHWTSLELIKFVKGMDPVLPSNHFMRCSTVVHGMVMFSLSCSWSWHLMYIGHHDHGFRICDGNIFLEPLPSKFAGGMAWFLAWYDLFTSRCWHATWKLVTGRGSSRNVHKFPLGSWGISFPSQPIFNINQSINISINQSIYYIYIYAPPKIYLLCSRYISIYFWMPCLPSYLIT
jgi:hypothetical protein